MLRIMTSIDVPRTGSVVAANLQHLTGKPWAKTIVNPDDALRRVLIEPRGTQRLSSQTVLDFRVSRAFRLGGTGRVELRLDVLNALNDTAEESIRTDGKTMLRSVWPISSSTRAARWSASSSIWVANPSSSRRLPASQAGGRTR